MQSSALDFLTRQSSVSLKAEDYRQSSGTQSGDSLDGSALSALVNEPSSSLEPPTLADSSVLSAAQTNAASLDSLRMTDSVAALTSELSKLLGE